MPKAWTDKKEYKHLKGTLYQLTSVEFERAVLPLVRLLYPDTIQAAPTRGLDRAGIDLFAWGEDAPYSLVTQCKGFKVTETELAGEQLAQCLASIDAFRRSGITAQRYLLVYNRDARNRDFREGLERVLAGLVASGQVEAAEHWPLDRFLQSCFGAMFERVKSIATTRNISARRLLEDVGAFAVEPIEEVPLETRRMVANQYQLRSATAPIAMVADPAATLLEGTRGSPCCLERLATGKRRRCCGPARWERAVRFTSRPPCSPRA